MFLSKVLDEQIKKELISHMATLIKGCEDISKQYHVNPNYLISKCAITLDDFATHCHANDIQ